MKKEITAKFEEEILREFPIRSQTPGWFFRITEISNGGYVVEGSDRWGRRVSRMGGDPEALLAECEAYLSARRPDC